MIVVYPRKIVKRGFDLPGVYHDYSGRISGWNILCLFPANARRATKNPRDAGALCLVGLPRLIVTGFGPLQPCGRLRRLNSPVGRVYRTASSHLGHYCQTKNPRDAGALCLVGLPRLISTRFGPLRPCGRLRRLNSPVGRDCRKASSHLGHCCQTKNPRDAGALCLVGLPRFELGTSTMSR